ncbi:flagellar protein FlaG [Butyrivibrio fibrisolvens]|uniref:Flagellar protein FlaG n=1 Tax=Butyrivibrio fibrisolvens TaxID=831 RepID=A0A1H9TTR3_BUTFI|nr:flagellar protein FlaG [Butyrivibrio fibrisolvens]SES00418.1 flagellar protein FlaG [Butyrivibrio fibrisolvens]
MAINSIQQTNIMQIQQMQQVQPVQKEREGARTVDTAGNAADQLAQEVETVKQATNVAPYSQEDGQEESQNQNESAQQLQHARELVEEQNEKKNEQISKAIANINQKMTANTEAVFGFHDKTNRVTIKIVDKDTKEVVKEFPPDKTLDMIAKAWELAGIMVDARK